MKTPVLESFSDKVDNKNAIKKRLQHRCFLVNIAKFLRAAFVIEHFGCLLINLKLGSKFISQPMKFPFFDGTIKKK